jgi:hypothetical protein
LAALDERVLSAEQQSYMRRPNRPPLDTSDISMLRDALAAGLAALTQLRREGEAATLKARFAAQYSGLDVDLGRAGSSSSSNSNAQDHIDVVIQALPANQLWERGMESLKKPKKSPNDWNVCRLCFERLTELQPTIVWTHMCAGISRVYPHVTREAGSRAAMKVADAEAGCLHAQAALGANPAHDQAILATALLARAQATGGRPADARASLQHLLACASGAVPGTAAAPAADAVRWSGAMRPDHEHAWLLLDSVRVQCAVAGNPREATEWLSEFGRTFPGLRVAAEEIQRQSAKCVVS